LGDEGKTPLYAAIDGKLAAIIAVADPIKGTTPQAIKALHDLGLKVAMITGDNRRTAKAIAARLGIDEVVAEVLPDGKVDAVRASEPSMARWPSSATASTMRRHWPRRMWASPSARARTSPSRRGRGADVGQPAGHINAIALSKATIGNIGRTCSGPLPTTPH
jgi:Au+-exporting ATPase